MRYLIDFKDEIVTFQFEKDNDKIVELFSGDLDFRQRYLPLLEDKKELLSEKGGLA